MTIRTDTDITALGAFDDPRYAALALTSAEAYQTADPFPHGVYDDFLPEALARRLADEFPEPDSMEWVVRDNADNLRMYQHDETKIPPLYREMLRELNSRQFLLFLETLTGIDNLLPDPYFIGGGIHLSGRDGFLNIHADFNWHHKLQAHRRVNALIYLSDGWKEEWGGAFEFWSRDMTRMVDCAFPAFNRMAVFSTSEHSHHGQPVPELVPGGHLPQGLEPLLLHDRSRRRGSQRRSPLHEVQDVGVTVRHPAGRGLSQWRDWDLTEVAAPGRIGQPPLTIVLPQRWRAEDVREQSARGEIPTHMMLTLADELGGRVVTAAALAPESARPCFSGWCSAPTRCGRLPGRRPEAVRPTSCTTPTARRWVWPSPCSRRCAGGPPGASASTCRFRTVTGSAGG